MTTPPLCPDQGSGIGGVEVWAAENCTEGDCENPATTCNGDFTIELIERSEDGDLITFEYKVCKITQSADLSHWSISDAGITCLGEDENGIPYELKDLIVGATLNGVEIDINSKDEFDIGLDPTTQVTGIKFNVGFDADEEEDGCATYTITFDKSKLEEGMTLGEGCVLAATKAGNQDIERSDRNSPGYVCIIGPVCVEDAGEEEEVCWKKETAWAAGTRYVERGNWATYITYVADSTVTLYAGQTMEAGTVHFSAPSNGMITITITLNPGWRFYQDEENPDEENVHIQDYGTAPGGNPSPGGFAHKARATESPFSIDVSLNVYYGVHVVVEREVECEEDEA
ncbi:MAG: hypothetical protein ACUBOA_09560 [Candidatus Loosdrechtia sp.]|uniref:hypothetical protein n=1 Tax=Candidatus Loosdrechtia sp. TaxID=3101272 RepID=UPI003A66B793|nr:MAG: hypothetical protein QY305_09380 [Candidatus Jettenia sp. AMX2]